MTRIAALALALGGCAADPQIATLRADLAAHDSATAVLETWCAGHALADPPRIEAVLMPDSPPATPAIRAALGVDRATPVAVRHVHLQCGARVLSDAYNWYVPQRLTPAMNATLAATRVPFGKVVAPLGLHRRVLAGSAPARCPRGTIIHVSALLSSDDGRAYSLVSECYTRANLAGNPVARGNF